MNAGWRKDPAAHHEWERRHRQLIIVPAVEIETEVDHGKYEPALWNTNPDTRPKRDWRSN